MIDFEFSEKKTEIVNNYEIMRMQFLVKNLSPRCCSTLIPQFRFLWKIHLIDSIASSVIGVVSWSHFDLSLMKPPLLTRYLSVNDNMGCPVIKRDRIHCVLNEGAMPFRGDPFNRVLAAKIRMVGISWISLRFPCATIFLHHVTYNILLMIK